MPNRARILVVDDELPVCRSVSSALAREGHDIETALSAEEALRKEGESAYDVIITDLMMPGLSGLDLLRAIKGRSPDTKVIMITGYPSIKSAVEATRLGAFDYIPKPFTPNELRSLVARALKTGTRPQHGDLAQPPGIHCIPGNSWAALDEDGTVRIGIHHLFLRAIEEIVSLELPKPGAMRYQGEACGRVTDSRGYIHKVWAPITGRVDRTNARIETTYSVLRDDPYGEGWLMIVIPSDLEGDLRNLEPVSE
jgi:DNA-binding response OmpR family regulator